MLNNSSLDASTSTINASIRESSNITSDNLNNDNSDTGEYESLWEFTEKTLTNIGDFSDTINEGDEAGDVHGDHEQLYENTGIFAQNFTMSIGKILLLHLSLSFLGRRVGT